jgi:hypothetical protein
VLVKLLRAAGRACGCAERQLGERTTNGAAEHLRRDRRARLIFRANLRRAEANFAAVGRLDVMHAYPQIAARIERLRAVDVATSAGPAPAPGPGVRV